MNDDLNTSIALSVIFELVRLSNKLLEETQVTGGTFAAIDELFTRLGGDCLGIVKGDYAERRRSGGNDDLIDKLIGAMIEQRNQARANKDYAASDAIRERLDELGIILEDKPDKTIWKQK